MTFQETMQGKVIQARDRVSHIIEQKGDIEVGRITIKDIFTGNRGLDLLVSDISYVDTNEGLRIHRVPIWRVIELLPKPPGNEYPLAGGLYYFLMVGELPTYDQAMQMESEWKQRSEIPQYVDEMLHAMPPEAHPMTMFSQAVLAMQTYSEFERGFTNGLQKPDYWKATLEDALNLTARVPVIAAIIYNIKYRNRDRIAPNPNLDWSANFAHMIGRSWDKQYQELTRLFFVLHSDQGIGNVSGHTAILVNSALSDVFYACSAAMNGLAGPLHGRANQDCLKWLLDIQQHFGRCPTKEELDDYIWETLQCGKLVPGYGHPVLRTTDPRFLAQLEFGMKYMPDDKLFKLVTLVYEVAPKVLKRHGKAKNPYPNIDAISGSLQYHCGIHEFDFYPVLFGVGRILGITTNLVWARALLMPLERPQSITLDMVEEKAGVKPVSATVA